MSTYSLKKSNSLYMKMMPRREPSVFQCKRCETKFRSNGVLQLHMRNHCCEQDFVCEVCNKSFSRVGYLKVHKRIHTGEKPHQCDICLKKFVQKVNLEKHYHQHTGDKPYVCDVCQKSFPAMDSLKNHTRVHSGEKPFKCTVCERAFSQEGNLYTHMKIHSGERAHICSVCTKSFIRKHDFETHIRRSHPANETYSCTYCTRRFSNMNSFIFHVESVHSHMKPFKCEMCNNNFEGTSTFCRHVSEHSHGVKSNLYARERNKVKSHISVVSDGYLFNLQSDSTDYKSDGVIQKDTQKLPNKKTVKIAVDSNDQILSPPVFHENDIEVFREKDDHITIVINSIGNDKCDDSNEHQETNPVCTVERKKDPSIPKDTVISLKRRHRSPASLLNRVSSVMENENGKSRKRRLKCSLCHRLFVSRRSLNIHRKKKHPENILNNVKTKYVQHVPEVDITEDIIKDTNPQGKLYSCIISSKGFYQKPNLERHMQLLSCERLFTCMICLKVFTQEYHLVTHMQIHSGDKPYKCDVCEKSFSQKGNLLVHMRIHTNEKPYTCNTCNKSFALKCSLIAHERIHSGERPYVCQTCGKGFKRHPQLSRHVKVHSNDQPYVCNLCNKKFKDLSSQKRHLKAHGLVVSSYDKESEKGSDIRVAFGKHDLDDCVQIELGVNAEMSQNSKLKNENLRNYLLDINSSIDNLKENTTKSFFLSSAVKCKVLKVNEEGL